MHCRILFVPAIFLSPVIPREKPDLNARLHEVPHQPGVYLMRDRLAKIIYVGKAKDLRKRLSNYFQPARSRMSDLKTRSLIKSIWDFEFHVVRNEPESLLLEIKLIKEYRPKYNISLRDDKRFLLLKVHPEEPWPKFFLTRTRKEDGARYFGPFAHSGSLRTTLHWMQHQFGLRSCRPVVPGELDYKHCHNDIIKNCCAPCIGRITQADYLKKIEEACAFLTGRFKDHLKEIEAEMLVAAGELDFERAAELRDMLSDFQRTLNPARRFTRGRGAPSDRIKPLDDVRELGEVLELTHAPQVMECFDISNISSNHIVASMVRFKDGVPDTANYRRYRIKTVKGQNDFASMAEVVRRRYSRILLESAEAAPDTFGESQEDAPDALRRLAQHLADHPEDNKSPKPYVRMPDLIIVDGGKGQLSSACGELQRLGLHSQPIIGLAKEREEVYVPDQAEPIVMPHTMGALKLLQRIRDEAHRWANGYHQILMKRRIGESILDDCPGISPAKKLALLAEFGSVSRLRKLTPETIARMPGVSLKLATGLRAWLDTH